MAIEVDRPALLVCSHYGSDCSGRLESEHITYDPCKIVPLCHFHNQVVYHIRRILALRLKEKGLRGRLHNANRELCYKHMLMHRFSPTFLLTMEQISEQLAAKLGLGPSLANWYDKHKQRPAAKPGTIRVRRMPIVKGNPVKSWDWKITGIDSKELTRAVARAKKAMRK